MSSFKKNKKASKYADCKNSGKESLLKYYGVKTERRVWVNDPDIFEPDLSQPVFLIGKRGSGSTIIPGAADADWRTG